MKLDPIKEITEWLSFFKATEKEVELLLIRAVQGDGDMRQGWVKLACGQEIRTCMGRPWGDGPHHVEVTVGFTLLRKSFYIPHELYLELRAPKRGTRYPVSKQLMEDWLGSEWLADELNRSEFQQAFRHAERNGAAHDIILAELKDSKHVHLYRLEMMPILLEKEGMRAHITASLTFNGNYLQLSRDVDFSNSQTNPKEKGGQA